MTATRAALLELATRCEQASGPDHVLDSHIHCTVRGYTMHEDSDPSVGVFAFWIGKPWESACVNCSSWSDVTASLDAALTLVTAGWRFSVDNLNRAGPLAICEPARGAYVRSECSTPALALCAAAFRALAAEAPQ